MKLPSVTPQAAKMISGPGARSRSVKMRRGSVMPMAACAPPALPWSGTSRPCMPPFRQRIAAAASTPSGAPPMPMTAWTLVPRTAAEMPAERSPSEISRMRAPALRISSISSSWRGRSSTMTTRSFTWRPSRLAMTWRFSLGVRVEVDRALRRRPDDDLLHVAVGRVQEAALVGGGEHGDRVRLAGRAEVGALERIDGDVDLGIVGHLPPDLLADEQHRRLVALALADDDRAAHRAACPSTSASPRRRPGRSSDAGPAPSSARPRSPPPPRPARTRVTDAARSSFQEPPLLVRVSRRGLAGPARARSSV